MPRQLIYTSAPRGLTPGQSGYCTVARSRDLREALIPRIEKLSYYTPEANGGAVASTAICAHRILDLRGTHFHVLSRIVDAGLDFTKRRSFLAHHLIFEPGELAASAAPAEIFLHWRGWVESWTGDPQWLEDNRPVPAASGRECEIAKADVWVTGEEADRKKFLQTLVEVGADWNITFTNCFQPGDHADDFDIKAAWPNTAGYEEAVRQNAVFVRIEELPRRLKAAAATFLVATPQVETVSTGAAAVEPTKQRRLRFVKIGMAVALFGTVLMMFRARPPQTPLVATPSVSFVAKPDPLAAQLDVLLPRRPTWISVGDAPAMVAPLRELMGELRANEVFTKDLTCTVQTNLLKPPIGATLFADPQRNVLRVGDVEIATREGVEVKTDLRESFAVEIPGRFRLMVIQEPVELSKTYLRFGSEVQPQETFGERVHAIELPPAAQWALRPLVKNGDAMGEAAREFGIVPSTILDLSAVQARAAEVIAGKEAKVRGYEEERAKLADEQRKLLTDPQTAENSKKKERLRALELAIPKAREELEALRAKAAAIPTDAKSVDRFALFLCLSNVNTEIFRFSDTR